MIVRAMGKTGRGTNMGVEILKNVLWIAIMLFAHFRMRQKEKEGKIYKSTTIVLFMYFFPNVCTGILNIANILIGIAAMVLLFPEISADAISTFFVYEGVILSTILNSVFAYWAASYHIYANYKHQAMLLWCMLFLFVRLGMEMSAMPILMDSFVFVICDAIIFVAFCIHLNFLYKKIHQRSAATPE